ncbi:MAG TPA: glycosyltransferase family 2 protein [Chitinophagaceae bacterium]|nr:glycosyltransferase family 2 protein [Chitinophagaceae bacterium]
MDDGSTDDTLNKVKCLSCRYSNVRYVSLSRNFGHQSALKAGLDLACGNCVISIDSDMQHPADLIPCMLEKYEEGYEVVYTLRREDQRLPLIKRKTSGFFYSLINRLSDVKIEKGSADFRLLSDRVVNIIRNLPEHDLFFRGLSKWVGFRQIGLEYEPLERFSGTSKYTLKKMLNFALFGISSFSTRPLYIAAYLGFIFSFLSLLYLPYVIYSYFFGYTISGWASVIVTIAFFGGVQLMILGIIGVYIGRLFIQSKNRPVYIIRESNLQ